MKKQLLIKTFLVAALLGVGTTSAWAGDKTVVKYSFDDAMSPSLTAGSLVSFDYDKTSVITSTKFLNAYNSENGDPGSSTVSLGSTDLSGETWTLSFEWAACGGCNSKADHTTLKAGDTNLFDLTGNSNWNTTVTITYAGSDGTKTLPVPGCDKSKRFSAATGNQLNTTDYWHHVVVTGSASGVKMTITNSSTGTAVVEDVVLSETNVNPTSLIIEPCCGGSIGIDELTLSYSVEGEVIQTPIAAITAVDGINRTVSFSCTTEGAALSYSTDNGANYTAGTSLVISANTNIKVKATKGLASAESENMAFEAGTEIVLNTPTWTKTGYSAGVSTVTLADNQSNKLLSPVSTIKYQINDGDEQTYSAAISVNDGETLKYWSVAAGYTDSPKGSVVANAPSTDPIFLNETYNGSDAGITVNTEEVVTTIGGGSTPYYYMYANTAHVSDYLLTSNTGASNWMVRSTGIYAGNTINYALRNVEKNDIVTIKVVWGAEHPVPSATDGTLDNWNTISGDTYVFKVTSTMGNFRFSLGRYASIKSIKVQRAPISATIPTSGYGTIASAYALDCANLPDGLKAYQVTGLTSTTVTLEEVKEAVAANTGLILKGTASTAYDIPVVASGTDISATNKLKAAVTATTLDDGSFYILKSGKFCKVEGAADEAARTVPAGKAYLLASDIPSGARSLNFTFDATAIKAVEGEIQNGEFYNVAGQRVAVPTKGLYIVNGKKVVVK